jgi:K+-sensing histidine kinase KdpD
MTKIELPLADTAASAVAQVTAEGATRAPIDWRQLSHELRTPLNAILGHTELLLDGSSGPLSAQARACLGEVQSAGRQLLRQVQLLLAWSELYAGRPQLAKRPLDLVALIRAAVTKQPPHTVQVEPDDARLLICGDRSRLQMLVAEIMALDGARLAAPKIKVETGAGHTALCFAWPDFCAARIGALQFALIETIAWSHGAELALQQDGVSLLWHGQPDGAEATGSSKDPK